VLLADVSGSMQPYARIYLRVLQGAVIGARAQAYVFATRLTKVSRALAVGRREEAISRALTYAPDTAGGTRIGKAVKTFLDTDGRRGVARGAVVVIVSDGWERADPSLLGEQMGRRHSRRAAARRRVRGRALGGRRGRTAGRDRRPVLTAPKPDRARPDRAPVRTAPIPTAPSPGSTRRRVRRGGENRCPWGARRPTFERE